jgi:Tat protein secretion system quality control protein TatD with DNase activity
MPSPGYHPWFSHSISLASGIEKETHYRELLLGSQPVGPNPEFEELLPFLPDPIPLESVLSELRLNLSALPDAMLGEVGIDRSFRIPFDQSASSRRLTKFTVPIHHQLSVLEAQLGVAVELGRNVSLHSVKAQMITVDLLERMSQKHGDKWTNINIDMHSLEISRGNRFCILLPLSR